MEPLQLDTGNGFVFITRQENAGTAKAAIAEESIPALIPSETLIALHAGIKGLRTNITKLGDAVTPLGHGKNKARAAETVEGIEGIWRELSGLLEEANRTDRAREAEVRAARAELAAHRSVVDKCEKLTKEVAGLKDDLKEKSEAVSGLLAQVEAAVPGPRRFLKVDDKKEVELLQQRVEVLVKEHGELRSENERLKAEGDKLKGRVTELANKARDEADVREREVKRLTGEVRRAEAARASDVEAAKSDLEAALAKQVSSNKMLTRRLEAAKAEAESAHVKERAAVAQAEEAAAALAKSEALAQKAARKAQEARLMKDQLAAELELIQAESRTIASAYQQAVKALGSQKGGASTLLTPHMRHDSAPWPRSAFSVSGSNVLHSRTCGSFDASKVVPHTYASHVELEAWVMDGCVLCPKCNGF